MQMVFSSEIEPKV